MTQQEQKALVEEIVEQARRSRISQITNDDELKKALVELVLQKTRTMRLLDRNRIEIVNSVYGSLRGYGEPLDSLLLDQTVTEIMINGPDNIFVERSGRITKINERFKDEQYLEEVIHRVAARSGREVNSAIPICDTHLDNGSRVNIVLPPIALDGAVMTIRKFSSDPMTIEKLISYGSITKEISVFLEKLVRSRYNIFIAGGTGSGKTTFLNALSDMIGADERVITIEDTAELQITHIPNLVKLQTRAGTTSAEKDTQISIRDLIRSSLRMRPDRIIVGECRGEEALDMLQAMNTGHDGSLSTGHANSARDMLHRLETMVLQGSADLPLPAIRQQISSALDIIIFLSRMRDHSRKTVTIAEVLNVNETGEVTLNNLYEFEEDQDASANAGKVIGRLVRTKNPMVQTQKLMNAGYRQEDIPAPAE